MYELIMERIAKKQADLQNILATQERHSKNQNLLQVTILQPQTAFIKDEITFLQSVLQKMQA